MDHSFPFLILGSVESTNNYAMSQVQNGQPEHGSAWFSPEQTAGKGQRGKNWLSEAGMGINLSVALVPGPPFRPDRFHLSALIALSCLKFLEGLLPGELSIKWPNDLYWRDRKAGGILIENLISGDRWKWSVAGIGINVNQDDFPPEISRAVSLKMITGECNDAEKLARVLHAKIMDGLINHPPPEMIMKEFNHVLYRRDEEVLLEKDGHVLRRLIKGVDEFGRLQTGGDTPGLFSVGEVSWL